MLEICQCCQRTLRANESAEVVQGQTVCTSCADLLRRPPLLPPGAKGGHSLRPLWIVLAVLGGLLLIGVVSTVISPKTPKIALQTQKNGSGKMIRNGDVAVISVKKGLVPIGNSEAGWSEITKVMARGDENELWALLREGKGFAVTGGTRVRVLDGGVLTSEIRVIDGPHRDRRGFFSTELLRAE